MSSGYEQIPFIFNESTHCRSREWTVRFEGNYTVTYELQFFGADHEEIGRQIARFLLRGAKKVRDSKVNWEKLTDE